MSTKQLKITTGFSIGILIISIIPILWISQYLHPFGDDYVFGAYVYNVWNTTHSFPACIQAAWNVAMTMYHTWQGTYSACFLMALQPGVFGQYWLGPIILLFSLIGSTYTILYMLMRKILHTTLLEYLFVSTIFVLATIQFTWSYYDAFFWYNGAMYYTLFYSLSLLLGSLLICYQQTSSLIKKWGIGAFSICLAIIIAGGNFVSGLGIGAILFTSIILMRLVQKKWSYFNIAILVIYGISFATSVLAPGNAYRQITVEDQPNIIVAFFMAIGKSFEFLADSSNIVQILVIAILAPVIIRLARASRFKFSHPWICLLLTTLLYSSFFFAHCYAMGSRGPGRVQNIYSYIHLWLICLNIYYLSGAIFRKAEQNAPLSSALVNLLAVSKQKYVHSLQYASYCVMGILILSVTIKQSTTNRTVSLILKGTVLRFDQEMSEREQTLKNSKDKTLALPPLTVKMPSDAFNDITIYPGYWINQGMANYYNKERIVALPSPNTAESPSMLLARCKRDVGPGNLKFTYIK